MKSKQLAQKQQQLVDDGTFIRCKLSRPLRADEEDSSGSYSLGRYSCLVLPETSPEALWESIEERYQDECADYALTPRQYTLTGSKVVKGVRILNILEVK